MRADSRLFSIMSVSLYNKDKKQALSDLQVVANPQSLTYFLDFIVQHKDKYLLTKQTLDNSIYIIYVILSESLVKNQRSLTKASAGISNTTSPKQHNKISVEQRAKPISILITKQLLWNIKLKFKNINNCPIFL